jgi:hypothetical protein
MERSAIRGRFDVAHFRTNYQTTRTKRGSPKRPLFAMLAAIVLLGAAASGATAGRTTPSLSFFSGGHGAHADWLVTDDQPTDDTDDQAIRLLTTDQGYAGILFHHVAGIPVADFPDSDFWNRTPEPYFLEPSTLGSPRLVVAFETATGARDGYADLRQNTRGNGWEHVSDVTDYPNSAWDTMGGAPCGFLYNVTWQAIQTCFAGDVVRAVYLTSDPYDIYHLIDDITVNGKTFSSASDNGNGINDPAGPEATTDLSLLPPLPIPIPDPHN